MSTPSLVSCLLGACRVVLKPSSRRVSRPEYLSLMQAMGHNSSRPPGATQPLRSQVASSHEDLALERPPNASVQIMLLR